MGYARTIRGVSPAGRVEAPPRTSRRTRGARGGFRRRRRRAAPCPARGAPRRRAVCTRGDAGVHVDLQRARTGDGAAVQPHGVRQVLRLVLVEDHHDRLVHVAGRERLDVRRRGAVHEGRARQVVAAEILREHLEVVVGRQERAVARDVAELRVALLHAPERHELQAVPHAHAHDLGPELAPEEALRALPADAEGRVPVLDVDLRDGHAQRRHAGARGRVVARRRPDPAAPSRFSWNAPSGNAIIVLARLVPVVERVGVEGHDVEVGVHALVGRRVRPADVVRPAGAISSSMMSRSSQQRSGPTTRMSGSTARMAGTYSLDVVRDLLRRRTRTRRSARCRRTSTSPRGCSEPRSRWPRGRRRRSVRTRRRDTAPAGSARCRSRAGCRPSSGICLR